MDLKYKNVNHILRKIEICTQYLQNDKLLSNSSSTGG